jgi:hypothetical protein
MDGLATWNQAPGRSADQRLAALIKPMASQAL